MFLQFFPKDLHSQSNMLPERPPCTLPQAFSFPLRQHTSQHGKRTESLCSPSFSLSKKWFAGKSCTKIVKCMPAGSGHGVSVEYLAACGPRFFSIYCPRRARRSRISPSAEGDQGAALDLRFFEKNRVKLSSLWQSNEKPFLICANC